MRRRGADHPHEATVTLASVEADGSASGGSAAPPAAWRGAGAHRRGGRGGVDSDRRRARVRRWRGSSESAEPLVPHSRAEGGDFGPLRYDRAHNATFERRAAAGFAHPLYAKSPGGVAATAQRVQRWRRASSGRRRGRHRPRHDGGDRVPRERGRPQGHGRPGPARGRRADPDPPRHRHRAARHARRPAGASIRITRRSPRRGARHAPRVVATLLQRRQRVDERFNPDKALAGTARYLRCRAATSRARTSPSRPTTWASATSSR